MLKDLIFIVTRTDKIFTVTAISLATTLSFISPVNAQTSVPRITPETIVRYLSQDLFISPGLGFKQVRVGLPFTKVAQVWGTPNKGAGFSVTGSKVKWVYLAKDSAISLTGGSTVKTIKVEGSFNSPFSSREGAHFGMTPHQVISIYGPPENKGGLTRLSYPSKGIEFSFENGGLKWMQVFLPTSQGG